VGKEFVKIGNTRIRKSNIKNFGVSMEKITVPYKPKNWTQAIVMTVVSLANGQEFTQKSEKKFLYVATFQNDNYRFYENEIDINSTLAILENMGENSEH
jgi:beta-N-acetylglucosaminidase